MTINTWESDLRDIAPHLSHAKQREAALEQKKKDALKAWEQLPENAALIEQMAIAKSKREALEATARAALNLYAMAGEETGDVLDGMYTIQQRTDVKVEDEAAVIEWIIRNAPVIASSVLKVDAAALKTAIINNPMLKTLPAEIKSVPGTTIQWKRLEKLYPGMDDPEPDYTPEQWAALKVWLGTDVKLVPHSLANTPAGAHEIQYVIGFDAVFHSPYAIVSDGPVNAETLKRIKAEIDLHVGAHESPIYVYGTSCLISDGGGFIFHQVTPEMMEAAAETARKADQDARYHNWIRERKPTEWTDNEQGLVEGYLTSKFFPQLPQTEFARRINDVMCYFAIDDQRKGGVIVWGALTAEIWEQVRTLATGHEAQIIRVICTYPIEGFMVDNVETVLITTEHLVEALVWAKKNKGSAA